MASPTVGAALSALDQADGRYGLQTMCEAGRLAKAVTIKLLN
ncbi:hypothetical protein ACQP06_18800 [Nocardia sp. CA-136227]